MRFEFKHLPLVAFLASRLDRPNSSDAARAQTYRSIPPSCCVCPVGGRLPCHVPALGPSSSGASHLGRWSRRFRFGAARWVRLTMGLPGRGPRTGYSMPYMVVLEPHQTLQPRSLIRQPGQAGCLGLKAPTRLDNLVRADYALQLVEDRADIDISGPEFNFVRSIRVFDVRYARQHESGRNGDCNRSAVVVLGTYGIQGDFSWRSSSPAALPEAHAGLERWGENCPSIYHRSVFVEWRDYSGNYGFEQVNY